MKNVRTVMVGMIKQSVLKQLKRGKGVGKGKILYWREGRYKNVCNKKVQERPYSALPAKG